MKEKRSLFETIFGKKKTEKEWGSFQVLNGYDAFFTSFGKETYDSKVARTAIDRISTHAVYSKR